MSSATTAPPANAPAPPPPRAVDYSHRQILVIVSGLLLGMLLAALDQTIVSTALTRISEDLHRTDLYSWVVTSYLLTSTASTPLYGKISDLFGRKRIFQFAIVLFLVGSTLAGVSQNMFQLIAFRAVQGLGAGGLMSLPLSIIGDVIPPRDRGRYQGYFAAMFGAASVVGPLIGGFLVDGPGWRWVFYVNLPVGAIALVVINRVLKLDHIRRKASIDWLGAILLVTGVSGILIGASEVGNVGHVTTSAAIFFVGGALLAAIFILWEAHAADPILPLRLFRNDVFRITTSLGLIMGAVMYGAVLFLPQYLQTVRGVSPTMSGLHLTPILGGMLVASITAGRFLSRGAGYKKFVVFGASMLLAGTYLLTLLRVDTSFWALSGFIVILGVGMGLSSQTTVVATQNSVDRSDMGVATSSITFCRTLGGAIGAAVLGAILIARSRATQAHEIAVATKNAVAAHGNNAASTALGQSDGIKHAFVNGMTDAYLWTIPLAAVGLLVALFLREVDLRTSNRVDNRETAATSAV